jgi:hypothetical protein
LETGFSAKAWRHLLPIFEERHQTPQVITCIAKLAAWNLRWYSVVLPQHTFFFCSGLTGKFSPDLIRSLREIVDIEGETKVKSLLMAPTSGNIVELMKGMFSLLQAFEMKGFDM